MKKLTTRKEKQEMRRRRVRALVIGKPECPRISVFRSLKGMFVQLIDDSTGKTLVSVSSAEVNKEKATDDKKGKVGEAHNIGLLLAKKAQEKKITKVVFDRAGYRYHGRVKAVAEGAREGGLKF